MRPSFGSQGVFGRIIQSLVASGSVAIQLVQGARLAIGGGNTYFYSDGSRIITLAGLYTGGNMEVAGALYMTGAINGPGVTTAQVYSNNINDGQLGHDFLVPTTLTSGKIARFRHGGGEKLFVDKDGQPECMTNGAGMVVRSANGTRYSITVSNAGAAVVTAL